MAQAKVKPEVKNGRNWKKSTIIFTVAASLLLLIANSGFWVNQQVFNSNQFADTVTTSLTSDSSKSAIASGVADKAFEGRPIAAKVLTTPVTNLVDGLLGTNAAEKAIHTVAERLNILVTSKEKKVVAFDLTGVKSVLERLSGAAGNAAPDKLDVNAIPDKITLLDSAKLPDLYTYSLAMLWITPIALLGAAAVLALPYLRNRSQWRKILPIQGVGIAAAGVLAMAIGPLFRPVVLGNISESLPRTIVGNLYDSFIDTYNHQSMYLIWIGVLVLVASLAIYLYFKQLPRLRSKKN